jgi:hypothetical protein
VTVDEPTALEEEEVGVRCWLVGSVGGGGGFARVESFGEAEDCEDEGS